MSEQSKEPAMGRGLTTVGVAVTCAWFLLIAVFVHFRWPDVLGMEPNEVGDFLAGSFAPLAFFWLILGFLQQGAELRNSGDALRIQGEEATLC